eukprot:1449641-Pleurochrysis_carterae.AAC.1
MLDYCEKSVDCSVKSFELMCALAHFSPGVARAGAFTPFQCPCCEYKPTEREWLDDKRKYELLSDAERCVHCSAQRDLPGKSLMGAAPPPNFLHTASRSPRHGARGC